MIVDPRTIIPLTGVDAVASITSVSTHPNRFVFDVCEFASVFSFLFLKIDDDKIIIVVADGSRGDVDL